MAQDASAAASIPSASRAQGPPMPSFSGAASGPAVSVTPTASTSASASVRLAHADDDAASAGTATVVGAGAIPTVSPAMASLASENGEGPARSRSPSASALPASLVAAASNPQAATANTGLTPSPPSRQGKNDVAPGPPLHATAAPAAAASPISWNPPLDRTTVSCTDDDDNVAGDDEHGGGGMQATGHSKRTGSKASLAGLGNMARRSCIVHNICHDGRGWIAFAGLNADTSDSRASAVPVERAGTRASATAAASEAAATGPAADTESDSDLCIGRMCSGRPFVYTAPVSEADIIGARGVVRVRIVRGAPPSATAAVVAGNAAAAAATAGTSSFGAAGGTDHNHEGANAGDTAAARSRRAAAVHRNPNVVWQPDNDVAVPLYRFMPGNLYHSVLSEIYPVYWALRRRMRHPAYEPARCSATRYPHHDQDGDGDGDGNSHRYGCEDDDAGAAAEYARPTVPANTTATLLITDLQPERVFADRFAPLLPGVHVSRLDDLLPEPSPREPTQPASATSAHSAPALHTDHPCRDTGRCVCFRTAVMGRPGITLAARNAGYIYMRSRSWPDPLDAQYAASDAQDFAALLTTRALAMWPSSELNGTAAGDSIAPSPTPGRAEGDSLQQPKTSSQRQSLLQPRPQPQPRPDTIVLVTREGKSRRRALLNFDEVLHAVQKRVAARQALPRGTGHLRLRRSGSLRAIDSSSAASASAERADSRGQLSSGRGYNFTVVPVAFERLSPGDAVRLMQRTVLLVGVHGAGLTNMMHMQPGTAVLELVPPSAPYAQVLFSALAHLLGLHHQGMPALPEGGEAADAQLGELHDPVRVHAEGVAAMVEIMLQGYDGRCAS